MNVGGAARHVKKFLIVYVAVSIAAGLALGEALPRNAFSTPVAKHVVLGLAIATILPSMIRLSPRGVGRALRNYRAVALAAALIFAVGPAIAFALARLIPDREVGVGFILSNVVPASSASLGYVLIAGGDVELALLIALVSLGGSLVATPAYLSLYASALSLRVPAGRVAYVMALTLLTPLALGQLLRSALTRRLGNSFGRVVKPYLSLATMLTMFALITTLVAGRARLMVADPPLAASVVCLQAVSMTSVMLAAAALAALANLTYGEGVAVAFLSALKNQSVAAAVAVTALGLRAGLVPALVPAIQAPLAAAYLHLMPALVRRFKPLLGRSQSCVRSARAPRARTP